MHVDYNKRCEICALLKYRKTHRRSISKFIEDCEWVTQEGYNYKSIKGR